MCVCGCVCVCVCVHVYNLYACTVFFLPAIKHSTHSEITIFWTVKFNKQNATCAHNTLPVFFPSYFSTALCNQISKSPGIKCLLHVSLSLSLCSSLRIFIGSHPVLLPIPMVRAVLVIMSRRNEKEKRRERKREREREINRKRKVRNGAKNGNLGIYIRHAIFLSFLGPTGSYSLLQLDFGWWIIDIHPCFPCIYISTRAKKYIHLNINSLFFEALFEAIGKAFFLLCHANRKLYCMKETWPLCSPKKRSHIVRNSWKIFSQKLKLVFFSKMIQEKNSGWLLYSCPKRQRLKHDLTSRRKLAKCIFLSRCLSPKRLLVYSFLFLQPLNKCLKYPFNFLSDGKPWCVQTSTF